MGQSKQRQSKPRYVELVRVSTREQSARDTPEAQRKALDSLRSSRPGVLVERIEEAGGISGAAKVRPDLMRLEALAKSKSFDELRVFAIDRLTRAKDPRDRMNVLGYAIDAGAVIVDTSGRVIDPEEDIGEMDYFIQTHFAARERKKIVERTMGGRKRVAALGQLPFGHTPYGTRWDGATRTWSVYEPEAKALRLAFSLAAGGVGLRAIARELHASGAKTRRGGKWVSGNVHKLLSNPACCGTWTALGVKIAVPPVVDAATFRAVQAAMAGRLRAGRAPMVQALLRGILVCGECGKSAVLRSRRRGPKVYRYYCCGETAAEHHDSSHGPVRYVRADEADELVRREVLDFAGSPERQREAIAGLAASPKKDWAAEVTSARAEEQRLASAEERALEALVTGLVSPDVGRAKLADLKRRREATMERLLTAEREAASTAVSPADMTAIAAHIAKRMADASFEDWRRLVVAIFPRGSLKLVDGSIEGRGLFPLSELPTDSGSYMHQGQRIPFEVGA